MSDLAIIPLQRARYVRKCPRPTARSKSCTGPPRSSTARCPRGRCRAGSRTVCACRGQHIACSSAHLSRFSFRWRGLTILGMRRWVSAGRSRRLLASVCSFGSFGVRCGRGGSVACWVLRGSGGRRVFWRPWLESGVSWAERKGIVPVGACRKLASGSLLMVWVVVVKLGTGVEVCARLTCGLRTRFTVQLYNDFWRPELRFVVFTDGACIL